MMNRKGDSKMGFKIRECRNEINMSQEELSKKSGVSRTIISGLENGTITVTTTEDNEYMEEWSEECIQYLKNLIGERTE